ncbi:MAG: feruloyl-CoA synthase [Sciscionella sp.]
MDVLAEANLFAPPRIDMRRHSDGSVVLTSADALGDYPRSVAEMLRRWANVDPSFPLIARRGADGSWIRQSYGDVVAAANAIGQALLERGLGPDRPLLVLSGNSIEHFLVSMGALTAGVPVIPTSVAYSLLSGDHARIRQIAEIAGPGLVFADDGRLFGPALRALRDVPAVVLDGAPSDLAATQLSELLATSPGPEVQRAFAAVTPDSVAKILFTSGSTGAPKGVLNTHRMLCSNQQSMRQVWPFLAAERPVLVDWLPWSHTFGGNHNVNMVLANGGTLYIDDGRPSPSGIGQTITNLREICPTVCFNVPAGWAQLAPALEDDREFAGRFFSRLRLMFNAAAALPAALRHRLERLAAETTGWDVPFTMSWGATETAPAVTNAHYRFEDSRCIGVPIPGAEVKLVPDDSDEAAYEIRVRGPMITPGYLGRPDLTGEFLDEDGFYRPGDAVEFADPADANAGLVFRGRIAEDFKLATGSFVRVGAVRTSLLSALPVLSDAVIVGENRERVCALAWLNDAEVRALFGVLPAQAGEAIEHSELATQLGQALAEHNRDVGSASRVERLLLLVAPPDLDGGEITDKGYINQRKVLANRAAQVEQLYADTPPGCVVLPARDE